MQAVQPHGDSNVDLSKADVATGTLKYRNMLYSIFLTGFFFHSERVETLIFFLKAGQFKIETPAL